MSKLYTDSKILHYPDKLKALAEHKVSAPIHIRLKPTNKCNHNCYYCCYKNDALFLSELVRPESEIPWAKMKELIADLKQMGVRAVTLSGGGEPLFYPHITETIQLLCDSRIKIGILTNGSLLCGKLTKVLAQKATWIRISMDAADGKSYAKHRKVKEKEFEAVCQNIRDFSKIPNRKSQLGINFIVTKENYKKLYPFLKLMKSLGVDHVKISEVVVGTQKNKNKGYHITLLPDVTKQVKKAQMTLEDKNFRIINKFDHFLKEYNHYEKGYTFCPFIQCLTVIGADMNVYACQDKAYTKSGQIGSIKKMRFKELWFSARTKKRMAALNPSKDCVHHCTQHNKNLILLNYLIVDKNHMDFV